MLMKLTTGEKIGDKNMAGEKKGNKRQIIQLIRKQRRDNLKGGG
jgi:hypothetical protein